MKNEYTNQTKQHTFEELALTAAKRVDIVKIQMVKDKSLLYNLHSREFITRILWKFSNIKASRGFPA